MTDTIGGVRCRRGGVSPEALLGGRGGGVAAPQVSLQSLLIGGLQALEQKLRLPPEVDVEGPVTPARQAPNT